MTFVQTIDIQTGDVQPVQDHVSKWHADQAGVAPGYRGARILADEERPGRYVIEVDFTSREDAAANNDRPDTEAWATQLRALVDGEPTFANRTVVCTTG